MRSGHRPQDLHHSKGRNRGFRLISKLPAKEQTVSSAQDVEAWEQAVRASCRRLGVGALDALLQHAPGDLTKPGSQHLADWLLGLRNQGVEQQSGMSIYSAEDLDEVNPALLDLVKCHCPYLISGCYRTAR
jgi:aryl-alcohol dehydrogenase-like predicted oxidoreductase